MANGLERLRYAVQGLAQPAEVQLQLYPDFVCKADELALDFDDALECAAEILSRVDARQRAALDKLDRRLSELSGSGNADFWTEEAIRTDSRWHEIRALAQDVLLVFGWPREAPPRNWATYVSETRSVQNR